MMKQRVILTTESSVTFIQIFPSQWRYFKTTLTYTEKKKSITVTLRFIDTSHCHNCVKNMYSAHVMSRGSWKMIYNKAVIP